MSKKITILNLNLWLLPKPFARDQKKRFARFIKMVKELQPDIITLQEVFLSKYIKRLHRSLGDYYVSAFPKRFINAPGLVIFTKERPYLFEFHFFGITEKYNLVERLAKKGFLMTEIPFGDSTLLILNTHLYSANQPNELKITLSQFRLLSMLCRGNNSILAGDLNLSYDLFLRNNVLFEPDLNNENTYSLSNKYATQTSNLSSKTDDKIDYILANINSSDRVTIKSRVIKKPLFSDHYPLFTEIEIK